MAKVKVQRKVAQVVVNGRAHKVVDGVVECPPEDVVAVLAALGGFEVKEGVVKAEPVQTSQPGSAPDYNAMSIQDLKKVAAEKGVKFGRTSTKADLIALLTE